MCVILHRLHGQPVDLSDIAEAHRYNNDGCGLMYESGDKIVAEKGLWKVAELIERVKALGDREYLMHLRIKTHGAVDKRNCHPFYIGGGNWMMHNGILSDVPTLDKERSDTYHFGKMLRESTYGHIVHNKTVLDLIESMHGYGNRMAFATLSGFYRTGSWEQHEGNWWSNLHWQSRQVCYGGGYVLDDEFGYAGRSYRSGKSRWTSSNVTKPTNPPATVEDDLASSEADYLKWWEEHGAAATDAATMGSNDSSDIASVSSLWPEDVGSMGINEETGQIQFGDYEERVTG